MRLEGTLDAFSLPDIFQLLSYTKKTGTLHLRRETRHGVVHVRDGEVTGARSDVHRQALARRLVGTGLVAEDALQAAVAAVSEHPEVGLAKALADSGAVDQEAVSGVAAEQATDAVFDLMRWPDGEFAFVVDEPGPDDVGTRLPIDDIVAEGRRRLELWAELTTAVPAPDAVVSLVPSSDSDLTLTGEEWALLSAVDGRRTVADLVVLSGRGEFAVVQGLAALARRGLLSVDRGEPGSDRTGRVQQLFASVETAPPAARTPPAAAAQLDVPSFVSSRAAVIPERPEPFLPSRQPEHREEPLPAFASAAARSRAADVGAVHGSAAMQPEELPATLIERDPSVNKSLLLRLIAGVRGL